LIGTDCPILDYRPVKLPITCNDSALYKCTLNNNNNNTSRWPAFILAGSYVDTAATGAGRVADQAADRNTAKFADLRAQYTGWAKLSDTTLHFCL